jgi:hypothetical protein
VFSQLTGKNGVSDEVVQSFDNCDPSLVDDVLNMQLRAEVDPVPAPALARASEESAASQLRLSSSKAAWASEVHRASIALQFLSRPICNQVMPSRVALVEFEEAPLDLVKSLVAPSLDSRNPDRYEVPDVGMRGGASALPCRAVHSSLEGLSSTLAVKG